MGLPPIRVAGAGYVLVTDGTIERIGIETNMALSGLAEKGESCDRWWGGVWGVSLRVMIEV